MKTVYFTMYNRKGEITRVVSCSTDNVCPPPRRKGEFRLKGKGDGVTQKVVKRKIVDKTLAEMAALLKKNPKLRSYNG